MPTLKDRASAYLDRARHRSRLLDHGIRTQQHYGAVSGSLQAGAMTYFAFLSFFPILAIAFFAVGYLARVYPDAQDDLVKALENLLPGLIGTGEDQISLQSVQDSATTVGLIGLVVLLYAGLGWISAMRQALTTVFQEPPSIQPSFVIGKLRDVLTLGVIGLTLLVSVAIGGVVAAFSQDVLDLVGLSHGYSWLLTVLGILVGGAADMVLFYVLFRLLARPRLPRRALWSGALLGAVGAEALKYLSSYLIAATKGQPAFQAFGIALILLVWINYFSRVIVYAAAWSFTSRSGEASPLAVAAVAGRARSDAEDRGALVPAGTVAPGRPPPPDVPSGVWFGTGAATMLALVALLRRRKGA